MSGIDWDKVRRNRKVWKSDYRDGFKENRPLAGFQMRSFRKKPHQKTATVTITRFSQTQPQTAHDIRLHLTALGLSGAALTETAMDLLIGKKHISWVECDIQIKKLFEQGFEMSGYDMSQNSMQMCFVKRNLTGEVEHEATFNFNKP